VARIAVIVATTTEAVAAAALPGAVCVVSGPGGVRAVDAMRRAVREHRPELIISAGFAGAIDPALPAGDVIRPTRLLDATGDAVTLDDPAGDGRTLVSLDRVASAQDKALLRQRLGADAVDMESFALAVEAARGMVPMRVIRAISDPADFALPPASIDWIDPTGQPRIGAVLRWTGLRPARLRLLMHLRDHANVATRRLSAALAELG
jgi:adenosylhomocysteine nucleosidase